MVGGVAAVAHHSGKQSAQAQNAQQQQEPQQYAAPPTPAAPAQDGVTKLNELKGLLDSGVLTQAEFDTQKAKILAQGI
jgi:membrane protease subunit (stomatin/prohibitin family)